MSTVPLYVLQILPMTTNGALLASRIKEQNLRIAPQTISNQDAHNCLRPVRFPLRAI